LVDALGIGATSQVYSPRTVPSGTLPVRAVNREEATLASKLRLGGVVALFVAVSGCAGASEAPTGSPAAGTTAASPAAEASPAAGTPSDLASVNCPYSGDPSGGNLTGIGATLGAFREAHGPQSQGYPAQFGTTINGGPNVGASEFSARCSTSGTIVSVNQALAKAAPAAAVKKAIKGYGILPPDSKLVTDTTPQPCEILIYRSPALAATPAAQDPAGTFVVELASTAGDLKQTDSIIYDLDTTGGC
jgi:hypothetical protein